MEFYIEILGFVAGLIYSTSVLPQTIKIIRLKEGRAVSTLTYSMQFIGLILWFIYGWLHGLPMFLFWQAIAIALTCSVLALKFLYWKRAL